MCPKCGNKYWSRPDRVGEKTCIICGNLKPFEMRLAMPEIPKPDPVVPSTHPWHVRKREERQSRRAACISA